MVARRSWILSLCALLALTPAALAAAEDTATPPAGITAQKIPETAATADAGTTASDKVAAAGGQAEAEKKDANRTEHGQPTAGLPVAHDENKEAKDEKKDAEKPEAKDEKKGEAKEEKKGEAKDEKKDEDKKESGAGAEENEQEGTSAPDVIPPPPEPTPEQLAKRRQLAADYESLAEHLFNFPVTGSYYTRYRYRTGEGTNDQDIYQYLSMDFGNKDRQFATGHFDLRVAADLDGHQTRLCDEVFANIIDTYNSNVDVALYSAYVDFGKLPAIESLRVGRQWDYETPEIIQYDGARVNTRPILDCHEVQLGFYAGVPVHQYMPFPAGNDVVGLVAEGRPLQSLRARLDFMHLDEDLSPWRQNTPDLTQQSLQPQDGTRHNNLAALSAWQKFDKPNLNLFGSFSLLDGTPREVQARAIYNKPEWRLQVAGTYDIWFQRQDQMVLELDPFTDTLAGQEAFQNGTLVVTKEWTDHFQTETGAAVRRLACGATESQFNHEFQRFYQTFQIHDLPVKGLSFSVTGSQWDGMESAPSTQSVGGDVTYAWKKEFRTSIGTDYSLYKYDFFTNHEDDNVRTYYIKQRWRPKRWATLDVGYEHESSRSETFDTFAVTFRLDF